MKYLNLKTGFAALAMLALASSCTKVDAPAPLGDKGQTIVKIAEAVGTDFKAINVDLVSTSQTLNMISVRRDAPSNEELQRTMTVIVKDDPGVVTDYNSANGTTFIPIPAGQYTVDPSNPKVGTNYTLVLQPGEFAKNLVFKLPNALALDLNNTYAFGFQLISVDADGHIAKQAKKIVVQVGVKNQWDGVYNLVFANYHPTSNPGYTGDQTEVEMRTTGANKVKLFWPYLGGYYPPSVLAGVLNSFLSQEPEYTINTATNGVTVLNSFGAPAPPPTQYMMNSSFNSRYEPGTKKFFIKYGYSYAVPGVFDAACREWTQTFTFTRPR